MLVAIGPSLAKNLWWNTSKIDQEWPQSTALPSRSPSQLWLATISLDQTGQITSRCSKDHSWSTRVQLCLLPVMTLLVISWLDRTCATCRGY